MKCNGEFIFKEIRRIDAGKFTNANGQVVEYGEKYKLKVDELTEDNGIQERIFKLEVNSPLVRELKEYNAYDRINLEFDLKLFTNHVTLIPVAIN